MPFATRASAIRALAHECSDSSLALSTFCSDANLRSYSDVVVRRLISLPDVLCRTASGDFMLLDLG